LLSVSLESTWHAQLPATTNNRCAPSWHSSLRWPSCMARHRN